MSPNPALDEMPPGIHEALRPLPPGYGALFARLLEVVTTDPRIRACWLGGSVGRGTADRGSDLDVLIAVADDAFDDFRENWRDWLGRVTPTIIAREIPELACCFYSTTPECLRLDVVAERVSEVGRSPYRHRLVVLDRDELATQVPTPDEQARRPDPAVLGAIVEEFFRQQAIFPAAVVAREDWLLGVVGVVSTQELLYRLFVEANQPLPPMGIKQWSSRLRPEQREVLESLPVPAPHSETVIAALLAVQHATLTAGRAAAESCGYPWPEETAAAVADYYAKELGVATLTPAAPGASSSAASACSTSVTTRIASPAE